MTSLLEQAFVEASKLPDFQQNMLAKWLLDEIISARKWESTLVDSEDLLAHLADEALTEHQQGKTLILDPDSL
ncbi:hypothetical protein THII_1679 [Thioploca ingrica]|jgi:hypothetical protein|uniref:Uncharacterized protein n=1 Tax=Thioploca ingrica TaxID=40754 RepID=A0A090BUZ7_9GAMM|nr:hypothetical protein THII_1679 [Thioploca ingrica]